jgi:CheY-like chemotaxis protein
MSFNGPLICIEDDDDDQYLIKMAAEELNIRHPLRFFSDGESALHYLESSAEQPFLILCDINLPRLNGFELRQHLNENEYLRKKSIPFVFITTGVSPELIRRAYDETIQGFFQKTTSYEKLKKRLGLLVDYWTDCLHPNSDS